MSDELKEVREFYYKVLPDCEKFYREKAPLNEFWGGLNLRAMREIIHTAASMQEVVHRAQATYMFSVNEKDESERWAVEWLLVERVKRLRSFSAGTELEESSFTLPELVVANAEGKHYTPDFLRCVNIAAEIFHGIDEITGSVVELGGGLGHLARVLKETRVATQHTIIDLPETLVFSYCFLKLNFPDASFGVVDSPDKTPDADFVFVPVAYANASLGHKTRRPDLFVNTASMGEMRNETVRYWMDFIQQKLNPRYLFMLNRYLNTLGPGLSWRNQENECQQHYDRDWRIKHWEVEPSYLRCPYVDTRVSRYVQIIAERQARSDEDLRLGCQHLLQDVRMEDWWRLRQEGHVMGMRDNPLCVDTTMNGTLYKLWELIRLAPSAEVVEMLLLYLSKLNRDPVYPFEELEYYKSMHQQLLIQGR